MHVSDTIAAIASPLGKGGVGVIRVSGPASRDISLSVVPKLTAFKLRYMHFSAFVHPESGETLESGCVVFFEGPASYTGEDVVEFHLHSNPSLLQRFLSVLVDLGARLAGPGEFTKRAFLNGKLDLSQAESVVDIIDAESLSGGQVALSRLDGKLYRVISEMRLRLMAVLEQMEGAIDFPDEVPAMDRLQLKATFLDLSKALGRIIDMQDYGQYLAAGVTVAIVGRPNVGKSSLLNVLLGEERAIVTPIPGTTRDFIDVTVSMGGLPFRFVDTAGLREDTAGDAIEAMGIEKLTDVLEAAHAVCWVLDGSESFSPDDAKVLDRLQALSEARPDCPMFIVKNKVDVAEVLGLASIEGVLDARVFSISAKDDVGIDAFKAGLVETFQADAEAVDLDLLCNVRQVSALKAARVSLEAFLVGIDAGVLDDMLTIDLKEAVLKLGEVTGADLTEEVLDGIFDRFCVGK